MNHFKLEAKDYKRDINILQHAMDDHIDHIVLMTGAPRDVAEAWVRKSFRKGGVFEFKDPKICYLERNEHGDRSVAEGTLFKYLTESVKRREIIAPTLTTYCHPEERQSLSVKYIDRNVKDRSRAKKEKFAAELAGNKFLMDIKENEQSGKKIANNAMSGTYASGSTVLSNKTMHNTLTSNCRSTASYGNANSERFIGGYRHYWSIEVLLNSIISVSFHSDLKEIDATMTKYNLHYPSVDETMDCIMRSSSLYIKDRKYPSLIRARIERLTATQRAAIVYTGDFYHMREFNNAFVLEFIQRLMRKGDGQIEDSAATVEGISEDYLFLAVQICNDFMRGVKLTDLIKENSTNSKIFASTVKNIQDTLTHYQDFIKTFWITSNIPASIAHLPDSIRHVVIAGDTDSTIFTVQEWINWYFGYVSFKPEAIALGGAMVFLASQTVAHIHALTSANFGVEESRMFTIQMKNEFYFPIFVPTQVSKHYFALTSFQEGNIFENMKLEVKGVHLKSSNVAVSVIKEGYKMMEDIAYTVMREEPLSWYKYRKWVADIERKIFDTIRTGSYQYYRREPVRSPEAYGQPPEQSAYRYHVFWNETFGPKYGMMPEPPYNFLRISTELTNLSNTNEWLNKMEDQELAGRLRDYLKRTKRKDLPSLRIPESIVKSNGVPPEILDAANSRKIVLNIVKNLYIILESIGIYMTGTKQIRLVSDTI